MTSPDDQSDTALHNAIKNLTDTEKHLLLSLISMPEALKTLGIFDEDKINNLKRALNYDDFISKSLIDNSNHMSRHSGLDEESRSNILVPFNEKDKNSRSQSVLNFKANNGEKSELDLDNKFFKL